MTKKLPKSIKRLYHISPIENIVSIQYNGLGGEEKFLFRDATITNIYHQAITGETVPMTVRDAIATNQLGLRDKYAIFSVDISLIRDTLKNDNVGECTAPLQYFTDAEIIPQMVKFIGIIPNQLTRNKHDIWHNLPIQVLRKKDIEILDDTPLN